VAARSLVLSPDDAVPTAARAVIAFHLRAFGREEARARHGEIEGVHQLRVAVRRLRAALRLFGPVLPAAAVTQLRGDLAWLRAEIGAVRDLDVLALAIRARGRRLDPGLRAGLGPLEAQIRDRRAAAHAALLATLDSARRRTLLTRLGALALTAAPARRERLGDLAPDLVRPLLDAVVRAGRRLEPDSASAEALHRLRVRTKRLRYALETLRGVGGQAVTRMCKRLERLQGFLGEHQDAVTQIAWLRAWAAEAAAPQEALLAAGGLVQTLSRRARRLRRRFPRAWRRIDRRRLHAALAVELRGRPHRRALRVVARARA
jgi:CHAD domain-containing protein